jgi:DNA-binding CsgD family transcriptional regulator
MRDWSARAVAEADALGDPLLRAAAHGMRALAAAWMADAPAAAAACEVAGPLIDGLDDEALVGGVDAAWTLAGAEFYLDRFGDAGRHGARALDVARASGQGTLLPGLYVLLATTWTTQGRLADAVELLDGAVEAALLREDDQGLAWLLQNRAFAGRHTGEVDAAVADAMESVEVARRIDAGVVSAWCGLTLGLALHAGGDARAGVDAMTAAAGATLEGIPGASRTIGLEALTLAHLELGEPEAAARTARAADELAGGAGLPYAAALAGLARARIALAGGDSAQAVGLAGAAVERAEAAGALLDAARARIVGGRALAEAGDRQAAVEALTRAADAFDQFGASRHRDAAVRELRRLGERVQRRAHGAATGVTGLEGLSERELEVARLTADRLTNREIAGRLFLSPKTVETHMRNLFAKLGVSSRVQVARAVERAERAAARGR